MEMSIGERKLSVFYPKLPDEQHRPRLLQLRGHRWGTNRIITRHVLPNIMSTILVQLVARFGLIVLSAASLGFLGLGVEPPQPEWGQLINAGRAYIGSNPGLIFFPGVALMVTVLGFNLVGDFLQDLIDPRLRR